MVQARCHTLNFFSYIHFAHHAQFTGTYPNALDDIFVRDRVSGSTERVSVSSGGEQGNFASYQPSISADGRYVAFTSTASNLVPGDSNGTNDIFVRDRGPQGPAFSLTVDPTTAPSNAFSIGTLTLTTPAPAGGTAFTITTSNAAVAVPLQANQEASPLTLTIPAGSTTARFVIRTNPAVNQLVLAPGSVAQHQTA